MKNLTMCFLSVFGMVIISFAQIPELVKDICTNADEGSYPYGMTGFSGMTYFAAEDSYLNAELWITDGTVAGTVLFKDINPGAGSFPKDFMVCDGLLYFTADDGTHGPELWATNGTGPGTYMVKDIYPGSLGSEIYGLATFNHKVYFAATTPGYGSELWVSDGTVLGTQFLFESIPGTSSGGPTNLLEHDGQLYFRATGSDGFNHLWKTNGSTILPVADNFIPTSKLFVMDGKLYCSGYEASSSVDGIWSIDAVSGAKTLIKTIEAWRLAYHNGKLYFNALDVDLGWELWVSDGTTTGTYLLKDIAPGINSGNPYAFISLNDKLYFGANADGNAENELWVTDGTTSGTRRIEGITPENKDHYFVAKEYHDKLYLVGSGITPPDAYQLWEIDGGTEDIRMVTPLDAIHLNPCEYTAELKECNGSLYFKATYTTSIGRELYKITTAATSIDQLSEHAVVSIYPNPVSGKVHVKTYGPVNLLLTDIAGSIILRADNASELDMSNLNSGIYLLRISDKKDSTLAIEKLVKQ